MKTTPNTSVQDDLTTRPAPAPEFLAALDAIVEAWALKYTPAKAEGR